MTLLSPSTGRLAVDLAPSAGGSIARFTVDGADVLRPMTPKAIASGKATTRRPFPLLAPGATLAGEISFHLSDL